MSSNRRPRVAQRAVTLVGVMILLFLILSLSLISLFAQGRGGDVGADSKNGLHLTRRRAELQAAQTVSEAGLRLALQWLMQQPAPPKNLKTFAPSDVAPFFGATKTAGWSVVSLPQGPTPAENPTALQMPAQAKIRFYPYASNATSNRKMFAIESVGVYQGYSYTARVFVRQNSFARYAYFSDTAPSGWWVAGNTRFQGPVHVNGVDAAGNAVDPAARINIVFTLNDWAAPYTDDWIFTYADESYFTTAMGYSQLNWQVSNGSGAYFYDPNWWSPAWEHITAAGRAPKTGQPLIKMPTATTDLKQAALGSATEPAPGFVGVLVPLSGITPSAGIYVGGDVRDLNLAAQPHADHQDQVFELLQVSGAGGERRFQITSCLRLPSTRVESYSRSSALSPWASTGTANYTGETNGVIYVNGNIGSPSNAFSGGLSGRIADNLMSGASVEQANSWTIATESSKTIVLDGGLVYSGLVTDASNPENLKSDSATAQPESGILGLVASRFVVPVRDGGGQTLDQLTIHAVTMAYDTFSVTEYSTRPPGAINLLGGFIVKNNSLLGVVQFDGTVLNGFIVNRNYDQRIADFPPPAYPVADRSYQILSFQKVNTTLN